MSETWQAPLDGESSSRIPMQHSPPTVDAFVSKYPISVLSRLGTEEFDRLLAGLISLRLHGKASQSPPNFPALVVRECDARFGRQLLEVPGLDTGTWGPEEFTLLRRALESLRTRSTEARIITHRQYLIKDLHAYVGLAVHEAVAARQAHGMAVDRHERDIRLLRRSLAGWEPRRPMDYSLDPMTALYALPGALLEASLDDGAWGRHARLVVSLCATALNCRDLRAAKSAMPAPGDWVELPAAEAVAKLRNALVRAFDASTSGAAVAVRAYPSVHAEPSRMGTSPGDHHDPRASSSAPRTQFGRLDVVSYVAPAADQDASGCAALNARRLSRQAALGMQTLN